MKNGSKIKSVAFIFLFSVNLINITAAFFVCRFPAVDED